MSKTLPPHYFNKFSNVTLVDLRNVWEDVYASDPHALIADRDWPSDPTDYAPSDVLHSLTLTCGQCTTETGVKTKAPLAQLDRLSGQWTANARLFWWRIACPTCSLSIDMRSIQVQARLEGLLGRKQVPNHTQLTYLVDQVQDILTAGELPDWLHRFPF